MSKKVFHKDTSDLRRVYEYFGVSDPVELKQLCLDADQMLMEKGAWDYEDDEQLPNQIVRMIEEERFEHMEDSWERELITNILWLWHHHAISCALWRYGDKDAAQRHAARALRLQPEGHPNKITRLLYHLTRDELDKALEWSLTITEEPEKSTAEHDLNLYKAGRFFDTRIS